MKSVSLISIGLLAIIAILWVISIFKDQSAVSRPMPTPITLPTPTIIEEEKNITITEPALNATVKSPFILKGTARVFENVLNYRLKNTKGTILSEGYITANAADIGQFGPYEAVIEYTKPETEYAVLEVFSQSAKDGSEINTNILYLKLGQ